MTKKGKTPKAAGKGSRKTKTQAVRVSRSPSTSASAGEEEGHAFSNALEQPFANTNNANLASAASVPRRGRRPRDALGESSQSSERDEGNSRGRPRPMTQRQYFSRHVVASSADNPDELFEAEPGDVMSDGEVMEDPDEEQTQTMSTLSGHSRARAGHHAVGGGDGDDGSGGSSSESDATASEVPSEHGSDGDSSGSDEFEMNSDDGRERLVYRHANQDDDEPTFDPRTRLPFTRRELRDEHVHGVRVISGLVPQELTSLDNAGIRKLRTNVNRLLSAGQTVHIENQLSEEQMRIIKIRLSAQQSNSGRRKRWLSPTNREAWKKWPLPKLFRRLLKCFPPTDQVTTGSLEDRIRKVKMTFSADKNFAAMEKYLSTLTSIMDDFEEGPERTRAEPGLVQIILKRLRESSGSRADELLREGGLPLTVEDLWLKWEDIRQRARRNIEQAAQWGYTCREQTRDRDPKPTKQQPQGDTGGNRPRSDLASDGLCRGCGKKGHNFTDCQFVLQKHPDANTSRDRFAHSEVGRKWLQKGLSSMTWGKRLDGSDFAMQGKTSSGNRKDDSSSSKGDNKKPWNKDRRDKSECCSDCDCEHVLSLQQTITDSEYTVPCHININNQQLLTHALIDTGALQSNYVSVATAERIKAAQQARTEPDMDGIRDRAQQPVCNDCVHSQVFDRLCCFSCNNEYLLSLHDQFGILGAKKSISSFLQDKLKNKSKNDRGKSGEQKNSNREKSGNQENKKSTQVLSAHSDVGIRKVCSGINGMCTHSLGQLVFDLTIFNEKLNQFETLSSVVATILDTPYEMIIGRPDIKKHKLLRKFSTHFGDDTNTETLPTHTRDITSLGVPGVSGQPSVVTDHSVLNVIYKKSELLTPEYDDDGIVDMAEDYPWEVDDDVPGSSANSESSSSEAKKPAEPIIQGSAEFQASMRKLIEEYSDIFSEHLRPEPADLDPMEIKIDYTKWQTNRNRGPPRTQTRAKEYEIERQINKMIANNVIKPSQAAYYSQVHLAPKPPDKWRFCLDFRGLNDCSEAMGWPIPNVAKMLQRLGHHRAKFYAVMDLTSGYFQAPLSKNSQIATAFMTFMGVFEWLRVPMGLKGAPSYFQQQMAIRVLRGLLYHILELYLDDIIVFGRTEEELLKNLRQVFERFRKHRLTLNPGKCRFGLSKVEYVGHTIDENGLTFSEEKRHEVLDFPKPVTMRNMKQFLGLANYFRDNVKNHSILVKPLQDMVASYDKNKKLQWTPELSQRFEEVKVLISQCPSLSFMDANLPIFLHTDASDYGIGAYLFQKTTDNVEKPIAFISKSLARERLRWSVPEKEAYAIFYAFEKLEYLIRDVYFVLRTDHKNLTYINEDGSPKVKRWKLAIQEFNFDIEHIAGEENVVADAFSRLCPRADEEDTEMLLLLGEGDVEVEVLRIPRDKYKLIGKVHNSNAGHNGVEKTLQKLERMNIDKWPAMREHVKKFIKECPICQKLSYTSVPIHTEPYTTSKMEPMDTINMDSIGRVPPDEFGNTYILVLICCFTRFVELYAVPDLSAPVAARCLLQHIGRYGAPAFIRSDQGPQFANQVIAELLKLVGTEHQLTLAYSKQENAIVERANKEVMRHLRAILLDKNITNDWAICLPLVQRIMNASMHSAIGVSPAQLVFGNAITLDKGIFLPQKKVGTDDKQIPLSEWAEKLLKKQAQIIDIAQKAQQVTDDYHISTASAKRTEFPINSYVLVQYRERPPTKFHTNWAGPMRVVNFKKSTYTLQNLVTNKISDYHVTQLKAFVYDEMEVDPVDIARREAQEFVIEQVLTHRGDPKRRTTLEFEVKWAGYDESYNSWQLWEDVRDNETIHVYLYNNRMRSLLTKEQKTEVLLHIQNQMQID